MSGEERVDGVEDVVAFVGVLLLTACPSWNAALRTDDGVEGLRA